MVHQVGFAPLEVLSPFFFHFQPQRLHGGKLQNWLLLVWCIVVHLVLFGVNDLLYCLEDRLELLHLLLGHAAAHSTNHYAAV